MKPDFYHLAGFAGVLTLAGCTAHPFLPGGEKMAEDCGHSPPLERSPVATQTAYPIYQAVGKGQTEQAAISRALGSLSQQFGGKITAQCQDKEEYVRADKREHTHQAIDCQTQVNSTLEYSGVELVSSRTCDDQVVVALRWDSTPVSVQLAQASGLPPGKKVPLHWLVPHLAPQGSDLTLSFNQGRWQLSTLSLSTQALWQSLDWDSCSGNLTFSASRGGQPAQEVVEDEVIQFRANTEPPEYLSLFNVLEDGRVSLLYSDKPPEGAIELNVKAQLYPGQRSSEEAWVILASAEPMVNGTLPAAPIAEKLEAFLSRMKEPKVTNLCSKHIRIRSGKL